MPSGINSFIRCCACLLALCALAASLPAQTPEPELPPAVPPVPESVTEIVPEVFSGHMDSQPSHAIPEGYWLVSTERSPQSFDDSLPSFAASVRHYVHRHGAHSSNLSRISASQSPGVPIVIVVHGSFMDSPSVLPESYRTWQWLKSGSGGQPFQMIYFTWPSYRPPSLLPAVDVAVLGRRASRNGFYLAQLIQSLPPECPISLVGHSHGTRVIASALHLMGGGQVEGYSQSCLNCRGRQIRCVFAASAIDHDWFNPGERFEKSLCCTNCILNLKNCHDPALMIYPLRRLGSSRALGALGLTRSDRAALGRRSSQVVDLDVSEIIGVKHLWPEYVRHTCLAQKAANHLYFRDQITLIRSEEQIVSGQASSFAH